MIKLLKWIVKRGEKGRRGLQLLDVCGVVGNKRILRFTWRNSVGKRRIFVMIGQENWTGLNFFVGSFCDLKFLVTWSRVFDTEAALQGNCSLRSSRVQVSYLFRYGFIYPSCSSALIPRVKTVAGEDGLPLAGVLWEEGLQPPFCRSQESWVTSSPLSETSGKRRRTVGVRQPSLRTAPWPTCSRSLHRGGVIDHDSSNQLERSLLSSFCSWFRSRTAYSARLWVDSTIRDISGLFTLYLQDHIFSVF